MHKRVGSYYKNLRNEIWQNIFTFGDIKALNNAEYFWQIIHFIKAGLRHSPLTFFIWLACFSFSLWDARSLSLSSQQWQKWPGDLAVVRLLSSTPPSIAPKAQLPLINFVISSCKSLWPFAALRSIELNNWEAFQKLLTLWRAYWRAKILSCFKQNWHAAF